MERKLLQIMTIVLFGLMGIIFISCGGGDENEGTSNVAPPPGSSENSGGDDETPLNVPERLKQFAGYWDIKSSSSNSYVTFPDYKVFFYEDGKCEVGSTSYNSGENAVKTWDYDENNKYLSIAGLAKAQWQITSKSDKAWSGLALWASGSNGYSANNLTSKNFMLHFLLSKKWVSKDVETDYIKDNSMTGFKMRDEFFVKKSFQYHQLYSSKLYESDGYKIQLPFLDEETTKLVEDRAKDIITYSSINIEQEVDIDKSDKSYIVINIVHPYNYENCYLNIKFKVHDYIYTGKFTLKNKEYN